MLTQLCYASRASFEPGAVSGGVEPTVARILQASRRNNSRQGIGGVLYYRDSCFFQVLEGPDPQIQRLLGKLRKDARHTDVTVLSVRRTQAREFDKWSMKYTRLDESVNHWLERKGIRTFNPLEFNAQLAWEFSEVLRDSEASTEPAGDSPRAQRTGFGALRLVGLTLAVTAAVLAAALWYAF